MVVMLLWGLYCGLVRRSLPVVVWGGGCGIAGGMLLYGAVWGLLRARSGRRAKVAPTPTESAAVKGVDTPTEVVTRGYPILQVYVPGPTPHEPGEVHVYEGDLGGLVSDTSVVHLILAMSVLLCPMSMLLQCCV